MLKHYIKFAFRNFKSNKIIFGGSLLTLCLGTLCIALLYSYVPNELNMDGFHTRKKDIYMIAVKKTSQSLPKIFAPTTFIGFDSNVYPELETIVSLEKYPKGELKLTYENETFSPEGVVTDSTFFQVFDFNLKIGDKANVLKDPNAVLLTEKLAKKIFGDDNPIGKTINVKKNRDKNFTVSGILENPPQNSSIEFDFIIREQYNDPGLLNRMGGDFILANKNFDKTDFEEKIKYLAREHPQFKESTLTLVPFDQNEVSKENLESIGILSRKVDKKNMYVQIVIMLIILAVSALNFSNLQIISSNIRLKNSALKRINGAQKKHLFMQFLVEKTLLITLSTAMVTVAFKLVLPTFNSFTRLNYAPTLWQVTGMVLSILCVLVILGSIYPFVVGSNFSILKGLKNKAFSGNQIKGRKAVVIFQYALTFVLLISSVVVARQIQLMLSKDLGFKQENIISAQMFSEPSDINSKEEADEFLTKIQLAKNEIANNVAIRNFAQGYRPIDPFAMDWRSKESNFEMETHNTIKVSPNYKKVLGLKMVEGRFFDADLDQLRAKRVVINETAQKYWNINTVNGKKMVNGSWGEYEIIGVVKDFNYQHLSIGTRPLMMLFMVNIEDPFLIEFQEGAAKTGLAYIESVFKKHNPKETFGYTFLQDDVTALYHKEKQLGINIVLFSIIAMIISVVGLFTIALYDTRRRVKEIAVRKVNGAAVSEILAMLNKGFAKWIGIAFLIACPIAFVAMDNWLKNFAYKTTLSWWVFALVGVFTLTIALLTVSWQSYKAASANPVKSLRTE